MRVPLAAALLLTVGLAGCFNDLPFVGPDLPRDYIRGGDYGRWLIEIDHVDGQAPSQDAQDSLKARMGELVRKEAITLVTGGLIPGDSSWTDAELQGLVRYQDRQSGGDTVVTYVVYVDGEYASDRNVLGIAYGYELVVIFKQRISEGCQSVLGLLCGQADKDRAQRAVLIHEFGHVLGLVDRGTPMVNDHDDGGQHSSNQNSVMYASTRTTGVFGLSNIPDTFDSDDKLDICAAGGKGTC